MNKLTLSVSMVALLCGSVVACQPTSTGSSSASAAASSSSKPMSSAKAEKEEKKAEKKAEKEEKKAEASAEKEADEKPLAGNCLVQKAPKHDCTEFYGTVPADLEATCKAHDGVFNKGDGCPHEGAVGYCAKKDHSLVDIVYKDSEPENNKEACEKEGREYTAM